MIITDFQGNQYHAPVGEYFVGTGFNHVSIDWKEIEKYSNFFDYFQEHIVPRMMNDGVVIFTFSQIIKGE